MEELSYCPKCGTEYREGFQKCADCDTELVTELPEHVKQPANVIKKAAYIISFITIYVLTVMVFAFIHRNSTDELATLNKNYDIMAKRAADSIAENDKLKTENNDLQRRLQDLVNAADSTGSKSDMDISGNQDIITIQKFEYKNFNYSDYSGRGAQLKVLVNNTTKDNFSVNPGYFMAVTDKGRTIPQSTELLVSYEYKTKEKIGLDLVKLIPETQTDGTVFFELRDGENIMKVIYDFVGDGKIEIPINK